MPAEIDAKRLVQDKARATAFGDVRALEAMPAEGAGIGAMQQEVFTVWNPIGVIPLRVFHLGITTLDEDATLSPG